VPNRPHEEDTVRDLITIMRRELAEYCNSPIGAIFLVVFALIASGLFVTEFFLFPVAELRGLFQVLPFMLCVFVPAVAMRLWAEERSSNTMEMLLTFPMHPMSLVLGKYLAGFCFLLLALASTLLLPLMVTALGRPDFGQIASSYLGAILLGGFFLALGQLVSGFARDQIVAFVLSLLACFGIFLLGTNFAATALDSWIGGLGTLLRELLGVTGRYGVFARGIVEVADLAFFLVWVALFLFLNGLHIEGRGRRGFAAFFTLCAGLCLGIGLFCNALLSDVSLARFDWTEGRIHSVSPASQRILAGLSVPVQISYYVTPEEDMPTEIKTLERDVLDRLEELRLVSGGKLTYKRVHMRAANVVGGDPLAAQGPNTDPLEKRMLEKGVEPFSVSAMRQTGSVSDLIYSSLGVAYKDAPEVIIPRIVPDSLSDLEYMLVSTVFRLTRSREPVVAVVGGEGFDLLNRVLQQEKYRIRPVALSSQDSVPADADVLLVLQPTAMNERQAWELGRTLAAGQKTIMAVQTGQWDYDLAQGSMAVNFTPLDSGLDRLFDTFGVSVDSRILMDEQNTAIRVARNQFDQMVGGGLSVKLPIQIVLTKDNMSPDDPITTRLDNLFYLWGAALNLDSEKLSRIGLHPTVLVSSSSRSWLAEAKSHLIQSQITPPAVGQASRPVAARISGQFPVPADPPPAWPDAENAPAEAVLERPLAPGELILIGGAAMFGDDMLQNNVDFLMNAVDFLAYGPELLQIRGKRLPTRLIFDIDPQTATIWKLITYCLPALAIAGLALSRIWSRNRRRVQYARGMRTSA